jgi:hypothetical protein
MKRIWQIVAFENNYDSYSSYSRDKLRYFVYGILSICFFVVSVYFQLGFLSYGVSLGFFSSLVIDFFSPRGYKEKAPKKWKVISALELEESYPVILDKKSNNLVFYEKKYYDLGESLTQANSVKEGFVVSKLSLENEVFFDKSGEKENCVVLEKLEYEDERFEKSFTKGIAARNPKLGESVSRCRYIVYTDNLKESLG